MRRFTAQMDIGFPGKFGKLDICNGDYDDAVGLLNRADLPETFGDGLLRFIQDRNPDVSSRTSAKYIEKMCQESGVPKGDIIDGSTMRKWFNDGPVLQKHESGRTSIFALAFALKLTPEDTAELFRKVYLDRAFDYRNGNEIVYYYCLSNNKTWADAKRIIESVKNHINDNKICQAEDFSAITDDEELAEYVSHNSHDYLDKNTASRKARAELTTLANSLANDEAIDGYNYEYGAKVPVYYGRFEKYGKNTLGFTYRVITDIYDAEKHGEKIDYKNKRLPDEIRKSFIPSYIFTKKEPTYEEMRKIIILLESYIFWKTQQSRAPQTTDMFDYLKDINSKLAETNFPSLHYENPYDWLFLRCASSESPLNTFRHAIKDLYGNFPENTIYKTMLQLTSF